LPKGVACSVSNCLFWDEGNRCGAKEITIEIDRHADAKIGEEFADEALGSHKDAALNSSATCCFTFQPKGRSGRV